MAPCSVVHVGLDGLRIRAAGCFALPLDPADCWILPRDANDAAVVECMMSMPARLVDWGYSVSTGPLVWNRHKPALHNEPRNGSVPIVWAESVTGSGIFHLKNEQRNHAAFYQSSGPLDPNLVTEPCVLVQRTTSKEKSRRLVTAMLPFSIIQTHGAVAIENHLNMLVATTPAPSGSDECGRGFPCLGHGRSGTPLYQRLCRRVRIGDRFDAFARARCDRQCNDRPEFRAGSPQPLCDQRLISLCEAHGQTQRRSANRRRVDGLVVQRSTWIRSLLAEMRAAQEGLVAGFIGVA
jgi:hypothetical protein